jgi:hypothetical protein
MASLTRTGQRGEPGAGRLGGGSRLSLRGVSRDARGDETIPERPGPEGARPPCAPRVLHGFAARNDGSVAAYMGGK